MFRSDKLSEWSRYLYPCHFRLTVALNLNVLNTGKHYLTTVGYIGIIAVRGTTPSNSSTLEWSPRSLGLPLPCTNTLATHPILLRSWIWAWSWYVLLKYSDYSNLNCAAQTSTRTISTFILVNTSEPLQIILKELRGTKISLHVNGVKMQCNSSPIALYRKSHEIQDLLLTFFHDRAPMARVLNH